MPFIFPCLCGAVDAAVEAGASVVLVRFCCYCCDALLNLVPVCVWGCFGAVVEVGGHCNIGNPHGCG
jgi:hypothetical protein